jgi:signal transduction histidine kinase/ActR/RegA family two-component response regulator
MACETSRHQEPSRPVGPADAASALALVQSVIDLETEEAVAVLDRDLRHVAVNGAWTATIGRGREAVGQTIWEVYGPYDERVAADFAAVLAGETVVRTIVEPSHRERVTHVELSPWRDASGQVAGIISRNRVETDQGLEARERRLRLAMETAEVWAFEVDFRTGVMIEEPTRVSLLEGKQDSYEALMSRLPDDEKAQQRLAWEEHLRTGEPIRQELLAVDAAGARVWRRTVAEAVRSVDGEVVGVVGVVQNIDARKRAELALVAEKEAAQAADRSKSEFLANISHEIRTPLNGVLGLASLLAKTELDGVQREMVTTIEASARTLNALMCDVLDLAKIESGRLELDPQPFDPAEALRHVHRLFVASAAEKRLMLDWDVDGSVTGLVTGDRTRLCQVLTNLTSNAVKFTSAGGVHLGLRAEGTGDDHRLVFTVRDTGIGIAPDVLPRLFERFVQADGSISRSFGGTGLGLAISRNLAKLMGGDITAQSTPGQGSTFTLVVKAPRWTEALAVAAQGEHVADAAGAQPERPLRVLLVEDHAVNRRVVELILADLVELESAENGALGLAAFRRRDFDVVLMDMQMPVMDGLEATRAIRDCERIRGLGRTPIIMLSANALSEHVRQGLEAGADFHLAKPITADQLIEALDRAVCLAEGAPSAATAG